MYEIVCDASHVSGIAFTLFKYSSSAGTTVPTTKEHLFVFVCFFVVYLKIFRLHIVCCLYHWKDHHKPVHFSAFRSQFKCKQLFVIIPGIPDTWCRFFGTKPAIIRFSVCGFWFSIYLYLFLVFVSTTIYVCILCPQLV